MNNETVTSITRGATSEAKMRRRSDALAQEFAASIRPLMPEARRAYGQQKQGTSTRIASDSVNELLLDYDEQGGNVTQLAEELEGVITLAGIRRRLRVARAGTKLGEVTGRSFRGDKDPVRVAAAVERIKPAFGTPEYGRLIRQAKESGLALSAIAEGLGVTYYTAWSAMSTSTPEKIVA